MMKKNFLLFLFLFLFSNLLWSQSFRIGEQVEDGEEIKIPIMVQSFEDIFAFTFFIDYDANSLDYIEHENLYSYYENSDFLVNEIDGNKIGITWFSIEETSSLTNDEFKLLDLKFQKIAGGDENYTITFNLENAEFSNQNGENTEVINLYFLDFDDELCENSDDINLSANLDGGIFSGNGVNGNTFSPSQAGVGEHQITYTYENKIISKTITVIENNANISLSNLILSNINEEITISLSAKNLVDIGAITLSFDYDPSVLEFISKTDDQLIIPEAMFNATEEGKISLAWYPIDFITPFNLEEGNLINLTFLYKGGLTDLTFNENCEISDIEGNLFEECFGLKNGSVYPKVKITNAENGICLNADELILTANLEGGVFGGQGVENNIFIPANTSIGAGNIDLTYSYYYENLDTTIIDTLEMTVFPLTTIEMDINDFYCIGTTTLSASPVGGTFMGENLSGIQFTAEETGNYEVTYAYTNENNCTNFETQTLNVVENLNLEINNLDESYCQSNNAIILETNVEGGTFTGTNENNIFIPSEIGEHTITYTYDLGACNFSIEETVNVIEISDISFTGLYEIYSVGQESVTLVGIPEGGTFSGVGINGNVFTPNIAGTHEITYTYSNGSCEGSYTQEVTVLSEPTILFTNVTNYDFGSVPYNNTSLEEKTYTVSAQNLTSSLLITAPDGFLISQTSGSNYTTIIALDPIEGTVEATDIYIVFQPTSEDNFIGNITHNSFNANVENIQVSGSGVNIIPVITTEAITTVNQNELYTYTIEATDGNNDDLTFTAINIPSWLTFVGNTLIGTPDNSVVGVFNITLQVNDGNATGNALQIFELTITNVNSSPTASNSSVTSNEDETYTFNANDFNFSDIDGDFFVNVKITALEIKGNLYLDANDDGILDANEHISLGQEILVGDIDKLKYEPFTNENANAYDNFGFKVFDGVLYSDNAYIMLIDIVPVNDEPIFTFTENITLNEDFENEYHATPTAFNTPLDETGQNVNYSISPILSNIVNLSINPVTGEISFTAIENANGTEIFTITANDGQSENNIYTKDFTLTINAINDVPVFTSEPILSVNEDENYNYFIIATDIETSAIFFSAVDLPDWLVLENGSLVGTPNNEDVGVHEIKIKVTDAEGLENYQEFSIIVINVNDAPTLEAESFSIVENALIGSYVGTIVGDDIDKNQTLTYYIIDGNSLPENNDPAFEIDENGDLRVLNDTQLDFETLENFDLKVVVKDNAINSLSDTAIISVEIIDVHEPFNLNKIENCFTPDEDGINDYWQIVNYNQYKDCDLVIFNSWREVLFTGKATEKWDGKYEGEYLPTDTYYYTIDCSNDIYSGYITIFKD